MMLSLIVLVAAIVIPINEIYGEPALNLQDILNVLDTHQKQDKYDLSSSSREVSDNNESDQDLTLRGSQLVHFLQQARNKHNKKILKENKHLSKLYTHLANANDNSQSRYLVTNKEDVTSYDDNKNAGSVYNLIDYLLSQTNNMQQREDDRNDDVVKLGDREGDDDGNLKDFSRIYVILNPEALEASPNKKKLSGLISRLMSKTLSVTGSKAVPKQTRYKGFQVKENLRRARSRDSYEFGGKDSMDESYSKKRPRYNNYYGGGGGGGGGAGRTAIPYIRHHGDIYERS